MRTLKKDTNSMRGFTIIELMIATAVFAVVLVLITTSIVQVSRVYHKGITEANTQNVARGVVDAISQAIQFYGGAVTPTEPNPAPGNSYNFCVGNQEFSYRPGYQLVDGTPGTNQTQHSLVVRTVSGCTGPTGGQNMSDVSGAVTGRELMSPNMRLSRLMVTSLGDNLYRIQVRVVYGDDDLLQSPTVPGVGAATAADAACRGVAGRQYCAVSEFNTVVIKRVE